MPNAAGAGAAVWAAWMKLLAPVLVIVLPAVVVVKVTNPSRRWRRTFRRRTNPSPLSALSNPSFRPALMTKRRNTTCTALDTLQPNGIRLVIHYYNNCRVKLRISSILKREIIIQTALLDDLYKIQELALDEAGQNNGEKSESTAVAIEGPLDKLPSGRRKATFWNAWKRRFFQAKDGYLYCHQVDWFVKR